MNQSIINTTTTSSTVPTTTPILEFHSLDDNRDRELNSLWCPIRIFGTQCPNPTLFSYYSCCGELNNRCCSHLRLWLLVLIFSLPLLLVIPFITVLSRRASRAMKRRRDTKYHRTLVQPIEEERAEDELELR